MDRLKHQIKEKRFYLLERANQLAPFGQPHQKCGLVPVSKKVEVLRSPQNDHSYSGLYSCRSGWCCPRCTNAKQAEKGAALALVHSMIDVPVKPTMLTYTLQHKNGEPLNMLLDVLKTANRVTRSGSRLARYKTLSYGYVNGTEITYSTVNGWHPHQHEINYFFTWVTHEEIQKYVIKPYLDAIEKSGRIVRDITVKIDEWDGGIDYLTKGSQIAEEITAGNKKSSINIMKILEWSKPSNKWHHLYLEFCESTKRRKVTNMSSAIREHYKVAQEYQKKKKKRVQETMEVVASFTNQDWKSVVNSGSRWEIIATLDGQKVK